MLQQINEDKFYLEKSKEAEEDKKPKNIIVSLCLKIFSPFA